MKIQFFLIALSTLLISGCIMENHFTDYVDLQPPSPPKNIYTISGDNWLEIRWQFNYEKDVQAYNIYRSYSYNGEYRYIGTTSKNYFIDYSVRNGITYYYGITAVDYSGNESDLSYEVIYDTPRPEGYNQTIFDFRRFPNLAGYDFSNYSVVPYDNDNCDMFFENYNGTFYMVVYDDTDIQDMGPTSDIYDIDKAPISGWSPTKDVKLYEGHSYVVWTWDNHFAKFRVKYLTPERIVFDWAYQLAEGNRELKSTTSRPERRMNKEKILQRIRNRERNIK